MERIPAVLALMLALMSPLVLTACGGDDGDAPTKQEFIVQADEICANGDEEIQKAAAEAFGEQPPNQTKAVAFMSNTVIPNIQGQLDGLRDLTPPDGDEDTINQIWDDLDAGIDTMMEDPAKVLTGGENPFADANAAAQEYGFESCGDDSA